MQDTSKLMLTIVAGGVLAGAWLGQMASPVMKFAAQPDLRERFDGRYSSAPLQFVDSGPEDLTPYGLTPGAIPYAATPALWESPEMALRQAGSYDAASYETPDQDLPDDDAASYETASEAQAVADELRAKAATSETPQAAGPVPQIPLPPPARELSATVSAAYQ